MEKLYRYDFKQEMLKMILESKKLTDSTIKRKFNHIWEKYLNLNLINYSSTELDYQSKKLEHYVNITETILLNRVTYDNGCIKLNQITSVDINEKSVTITLKDKRQINLSHHYKFLKNILEKKVTYY
jgi:hypothetical protein